MNLALCAYFLVRSHVAFLDSKGELYHRRLLALAVVLVLGMLFVVCLEPFRKFRSVIVDEKTVELISSAGAQRIDRTSIADVVVMREDEYDRNKWTYRVEIHTKSGKSYRSVDLGSYNGGEPLAAQWWQHLNRLKSTIEN